MTRALSRNFLAQIYSQTVTIAVQLGMVPFLIHAWGVDQFGVWVLLTAIPAYLSFSDFGFTFIAKNDMAIRVSQGDRAGALETFQSILILLCGMGSGLFVLLAGLVLALPLDAMFNLGSQTLTTAREVLVFQIAAALLFQVFLLMGAGVRCEGRAALEFVFTGTSRLLEAAAILIVALTGHGLADAALAALIARGCSLVLILLWLRRTTPWLRIGVASARLARLRALFGPSLTYMMVPISNALLIQAPVVLLGIIATPAVVALFAVTRTVARFGISMANMINYTFAPEYSFAFGRRDYVAFRRFMWLQGVVIISGTVSFGAMSFWLVPFGVRFLSGNAIIPDTGLSWIMAAAVIAEILWNGAFSPLSAVNRHRGVALSFLVASVLAILAASLAGTAWTMGVWVLLAHCLTLIIAVLQLRRFINHLAFLSVDPL